MVGWWFRVLVLAVIGLLGGCSSSGGPGGGTEGSPVALFDQKNLSEAPAKNLDQTHEAPATVQVQINQADLQKAIHRYRLSAGKMTGSLKISGVDLNGDGVGEALVLFEGDGWCISTGCHLVVFAKGVNGFRPMSVIKRVKLPVVAAANFSEGWRDLIVKSGNQSIGERLVLLKFRGNYPGNATTVAEKLAFLPPRSEVLLAAETPAAALAR